MLSNIVSLKKILLFLGSWKNNNNFISFKILLETKLDPTIINGGVINSLQKITPN